MNLEISKKNYGLMTFQKDRAINISNVNEIKLGEYTRTNIKRVFGSVELGHVFKPDNNKQEFYYGNLKDEFKELVKDLGADLLKLADSVAFTIGKKQKVKNINNDSAQSKIENALSAKTKNSDWIIEPEGSKVKISISENENVNIQIKEISIDDKDNKSYFINPRIISEAKKEFEIEYNINHPIWKPLTTPNAIDTKTVLYSLIAIIGISSLEIGAKIFYDSCGAVYSNDFIEIINLIADYTVK